VTRKLIFLAYFQIGIMQAMAGFFAWMVILNDYGFPPHILYQIDTGAQWAKDPLFCRFSGGYYVNEDGVIDTSRNPETDAPSIDYPLWDNGDAGYLKDCEFPLRNFLGSGGIVDVIHSSKANDGTSTNGGDASAFNKNMYKTAHVTIEAVAAMEYTNYFEYIPYRSRMSFFWKNKWLSWPLHKSEGLGGAFQASEEIFFTYNLPGVYSVCAADSTYNSKSNIRDSPNDKVRGSPEAIKAVKDITIKELRDAGGPMGAAMGVACPSVGNGVAIGDKNFRNALFMNGDLGAGGNNNNIDAAFNTSSSIFQNDFVMRHMPRYCMGADTGGKDGKVAKSSCGVGCWNQAGGSMSADFDPYASDLQQCVNIASRMTQAEALYHARAGYWVSIVVVQWSDLLICKTRWLSIRGQGLRNTTLNFGLFFETLLAGWLCYYSVFAVGLQTRPIRFTHWMPGIPWSIIIFMYDEVRKYLMRATSPEIVDPDTKQVKRIAGWIELNTYY
jgi:sodium/potassium-transporting ATPase subunit alpha